MASSSNHNGRASTLLLVGAAFVLGAALLGTALLRMDRASPDTLVVEAVCRHLLANTTEGRQALVSSMWWPPLPVLLRLPFVAMFGADACPISSLIVSAAFGAALLVLLSHVLRLWGVGKARFVIAAAVALNPRFLEACWDGSSLTTVAFLALVTVYGLVQWSGTRSLRFLGYLAFASSLLVLTSAEMVAWLGIVFLLLVVDEWLTRAPRAQKEAVMLLGFAPALYAAGLWLLMNWLVMGDGLYFVRSLLSPPMRAALADTPQATVARVHYAGAGIALLGVVISAAAHSRAGVFAGLAGMTPLVLALALRAAGLLWDPSVVLFAAFPLVIVVIGRAMSLPGGRVGPALRAAAALVAVAFSVSTAVDLRPGPGALAPATLAEAAGSDLATRHEIRRHVLERSPYATVFVCGYEAFRLIGPEPDPVFVPSLDLNFYKAREDYYGRTLFVLVRRPEGHSAMDSVHWQYNGIYVLGHRSTLYDADWNGWRLFEIIQAPRP